MKLQPLLNEYLIAQGSLPLAGIGQLSVESSSAHVQEDDLLLAPPASIIVFSSVSPQAVVEKHLIEFLSSRLYLSNEQASALLEQEENLQKVLSEDNPFHWASVGSFQKEADGTILFSQEEGLNNYLPAIQLHPIQRQPAVEPVAEPQEMMEEPLYESEEIKKERWWIWAIIIFIIAAGLILFYYVTYNNR